MLRKFHIARTKETPEVTLDPESSKFSMVGNSVSENSFNFYKPVIDAIDQYQNAGVKIRDVEIDMEYFNSSSSKIILDVLLRIKKSNSDILVRWIVKSDDVDMIEAAEDYMAIVNAPFEIIKR